MRTSTIAALTISALLGAATVGVGTIAADDHQVDASAGGRVVTPVVEVLTTTVATTPAAQAPIHTSMDPELEVTGAGAVQLAALDEAVARFRREGLALPNLDIEFFDDMANCRGHYGLFVSAGDRWQVSICSDVPFVITHELAHAWTAAHLDDAERHEYTARRGLAAWDGSELEWNQRGIEDAAFIIQQNLMASPARVDTPRWIEQMAAYEQLTGQASPVRKHQT